MFVSPRKAGIWGQFRARGDSQPGGEPDSWTAEGWTRLDSSLNMGRNGGLSGPGKRRLFLPGEESRRQWWSLTAHDGNGAKAGTRGKETSQCRSNGYLDYCIEAVVQEMEGCSGNPVTKSGLSLGRPGVGGGLGEGGREGAGAGVVLRHSGR